MTEREAIALTYFDSCSIYRRDKIKDPATKQMVQTDILIQDKVSCALSQDSGRELSLSGDFGNASGNYTLFCSDDEDIQKGDKLVILTKAGQTFTLWAGKPFAYPNSHTEIPLSEDERS